MRCFLLMLGLLSSFSYSSWAGDEKQPKKAPSDYIKVEIRGRLNIGADQQELVDRQALQFGATILDMGLIFGENKELAALAKKLDGKTALVNGYLRRWAPLTAGPPTHYVSYVEVTALKAAE
jgi:hypothetical protein